VIQARVARTIPVVQREPGDQQPDLVSEQQVGAGRGGGLLDREEEGVGEVEAATPADAVPFGALHLAEAAYQLLLQFRGSSRCLAEELLEHRMG